MRHGSSVPELRHLRYFVAVAEELSFSRAADRLHMATSPLSAAIKQLEDELGVRLFVRTTRSVELTDAGRRLLRDAPAALAAVDAAFADAVRAGRGVLGTLRLGASPAARHELRPRLLAALRDRHPGIEVDVSEATTGRLIRELLGHRLDVALLFCSGPTPGLARRPLATERLGVLLRPSHPRAGAEELGIEELAGSRFVVPAEDLNPGFNAQLRAICAEHGFTPATVTAGVIWDQDEWPTGDDVVALATERWLRHRPPGLVAARLVPEHLATIELAWREDDPSPLVATLLGVIEDWTPQAALG
jgi:DNA-binding transcriptional LysR family regulator